MIFSILFIEMTLRWNSITEVYQIKSTGQLIPFIVGLGTLAKCLNDLWTTHLSKSFVSAFPDFDWVETFRNHSNLQISLLVDYHT